MEVDKSDNLITFDFGENFTFGSNNSFDQNIANSYSYVTSIRIVMLSVLLAAAVVGNSLAFHKLVTNRSQNSLPGGWFSDSLYLMHKYICFLLSLSKFAKTNKTIIHHLLFLRPFRRGKEQSVTSRSREFPVPGILLLFGWYRYRKKLVPEKSTGPGAGKN